MPTLALEPGKTFAHQNGRVEGYNSICPTCFRIVASASHEKDLCCLERKHVCSPDDLAFLPKFGPQ